MLIYVLFPWCWLQENFDSCRILTCVIPATDSLIPAATGAKRGRLELPVCRALAANTTHPRRGGRWWRVSLLEMQD